MEKRTLAQLSVYEIDDNVEALSLETLKPLYIRKTSEIVYITKDNRLYGVVCLGDVLRNNNGRVRINTHFTQLADFDLIGAREIFQEKININKIPIVNERGELQADYSRWDDNLFIQRNDSWFANKELLEKVLKSYNKVYLIEPDDSGNSSYLYFKRCLNQFGISYVCIKKMDCPKQYLEDDVFIFLNEDERRGIQCLLQVYLGDDERPVNSQRYEKWMTFKSLLLQMMKERDLEAVNEMGNFFADSNKCIDEKATVIFSELNNKGVHCLAIYADNSADTEYTKRFNIELAQRLHRSPCLKEVPWLTGEAAEKFWDKLYLSEDYQDGTAQRELLEGWLKGRYENLDGKYCKTKSGRRVTYNQPDEYIGTIYFLGPCMIFGAYAEDKYTIESYLQEKLLEKGYPYRVENLASPLRLDSELEGRLMEIGNYSSNDVVIYLTQAGEVANIENCFLWEIYEEENIPTDWVTNWYLHCNHKINEIMAAHILRKIEPGLYKKGKEEKNVRVDFKNIMKRYVYHKYLTKYFTDYFNKDHGIVGAIVMNCNPFSKGHRYLIEQAKKQVDYLIIFLVEEDKSLFSFEERYRMAIDGIKDLDNIMMVPSGEFILSRNTFEEYFTKVETALIKLNAEYDINIFADYIAPPLHITYRFAGEEPTDRVTKIYNETMKKILFKKGISFIEIPRQKIQNEIISASQVRKYLKCSEYEMAAKLVPETTFTFLMT